MCYFIYGFTNGIYATILSLHHSISVEQCSLISQKTTYNVLNISKLKEERRIYRLSLIYFVRKKQNCSQYTDYI